MTPVSDESPNAIGCQLPAPFPFLEGPRLLVAYLVSRRRIHAIRPTNKRAGLATILLTPAF